MIKIIQFTKVKTF